MPPLAFLRRYRITLLVIPLSIGVAIAGQPQVAWDYLRAFLIAVAAMLAVTAVHRAFGVMHLVDGDRRTRERRAVNRFGAISYALFCAMAIVRIAAYLGDPPHIETLALGAAAITTGVVAYFREGRGA